MDDLKMNLLIKTSVSFYSLNERYTFRFSLDLTSINVFLGLNKLEGKAVITFQLQRFHVF